MSAILEAFKAAPREICATISVISLSISIPATFQNGGNSSFSLQTGEHLLTLTQTADLRQTTNDAAYSVNNLAQELEELAQKVEQNPELQELATEVQQLQSTAIAAREQASKALDLADEITPKTNEDLPDLQPSAEELPLPEN